MDTNVLQDTIQCARLRA